MKLSERIREAMAKHSSGHWREANEEFSALFHEAAAVLPFREIYDGGNEGRAQKLDRLGL